MIGVHAGRRSTCRRPRGFTLVELVVASGIAALLLVSLGSVVLLSSRAMPGEASASQQSLAAAAVVADLRAELQSAERIVVWSDRMIAFTVPDRDADGRPERITYEWSGVAGDPLRRRYGAAPAADMLADVQRFHLVPRRRVVTELVPATAVEDADESEITAFDAGVADGVTLSVPGLGLQIGLGGGGGGDELPPLCVPITRDWWAGQMIEPRFASDVVGWRPTSVELALDGLGVPAETLTMRMHPAQRGLPGPEIIASGIVSDSTDPATVTFGSTPIVARGDSSAVVVEGSRPDEDSCSGAFWVAHPGVHGRLASLDAGVTWVRTSGQSLEHRMFGRLLRSSGRQPIHHVAAEGIDLRLDVGPTESLEASLDLPAGLPMRAAHWTLDLDAGDPTARDDDADGSADWSLRTAPPFDRTTGPIIDAQPPDALDSPFVVEMEARCSSVGSGVVVRVEADNDASGSMPILLALQATDSRAQSVTIMASHGGVLSVLAVARDVPMNTDVSVRLVVDPGNAGVHVVVNDRDFGTLPIERSAVPPVHGGAMVSLGGSGVEMVRVAISRPEPLP